MYYKNQHVLLASKHEKEQAIAEPFMKRLSCTLNVHDFDTDQFGTFTGEIARTLSPYETCLLKAKTAAKRYNYRLAVASEGSFGPHPAFPFVPSDHELMVFIDREHDWIIAEQLVSQKTNYAMLTVNKNTDIDAFLKQVHFPTHALIVQTSSDNRVVAKGINNLEHLTHHLALGFKNEKELLLATDMRAMMNPTRMTVIGELADKLTQRIANLCVRCECPGFGFKSTKGTLPCSLCGSPTSLYEEEVWGCIACQHQEYKMRKDGLLKADPAYCDYCNP
ncbi:DUF6671 family protein [Legionella bononiensis]|uniref:DUF6671 domain-containing protein n=1 Tax=Legionella bononiensis TaxID=2793102 RepID=A0ABS1WAM9_9GAMM|nr:DUF6671 family protein [Legionella bononiensis]MBL7480352.1 hypothetical protein [Legionella bononiensis]MBL7526416.1 hypothetical protein [Legionella bononiensis]MBL7563090.1 hypothetical protein [Legionella bononiensis]